MRVTDPSHLWGTVAGERVCVICYAAPEDGLAAEICLSAVGLKARETLLAAAIRNGEVPPGTTLPTLPGPPGRRARELTDRERALLREVDELRAGGDPLNEIADALGVTTQSIHRLRARAGAKADES